MVTKLFVIDLDLRTKWIVNAEEGMLEGMKEIYKTLKNRRREEAIKKWRYFYGDTVLIRATFYGRVKIVKWLLKKVKVDVNEQGLIGRTALHVAATMNQIPCARALLRYNAALLEDRYGDTPLDNAGSMVAYKEMKNLLKSHFNNDSNINHFNNGILIA